jgi:hypothetical protein
LQAAGLQEPLYLTDGTGHTCRLVFDCQNCEMTLLWMGRDR